MKKITLIREALDQTPNSRMKFEPENDFLGNEEGIGIETIYSGGLVSESEGRNLSVLDGMSSPQSRKTENSGSAFLQSQILVEFGAAIDDKLPLLKGDEGERIRKSIELSGMEALGCYVSFHAKAAQWGIYIPVSGMAYMVQNAFHALDASPVIKWELAFHSILNHELFHFASDYALSQLEMLWNDAIWVPAREWIRKDEPHYLEREEKLANAYMLGHLRSAPKAKGKTEALHRFVSKQPPGYRDGPKVQASQWDDELKLLVNDYRDFDYAPLFDFPVEWAVLYPLSPRVDWRYCPIHVIHDERRLNIPDIYINLFTKIDKLEESVPFRRLLNRLPIQVQNKWEKFKHMSSVLLTPGMRFQQWQQAGDDVYSVRVDDNYRAHLKFHSKGQSWTALSIGNHAEMGHG